MWCWLQMSQKLLFSNMWPHHSQGKWVNWLWKSLLAFAFVKSEWTSLHRQPTTPDVGHEVTIMSQHLQPNKPGPPASLRSERNMSLLVFFSAHNIHYSLPDMWPASPEPPAWVTVCHAHAVWHARFGQSSHADSHISWFVSPSRQADFNTWVWTWCRSAHCSDSFKSVSSF